MSNIRMSPTWSDSRLAETSIPVRMQSDRRMVSDSEPSEGSGLQTSETMLTDADVRWFTRVAFGVAVLACMLCLTVIALH